MHHISRLLEPNKQDKDTYVSENICQTIKRAERIQHKIGWRQFIRGGM
jgi:hypothetical protein